MELFERSQIYAVHRRILVFYLKGTPLLPSYGCSSTLVKYPQISDNYGKRTINLSCH